MSLKELLKYILPVTFHKLDCENDKFLRELQNSENLTQHVLKEILELKQTISNTEEKLKQYQEENLLLNRQLENILSENMEQCQKENSILKQQLEKTLSENMNQTQIMLTQENNELNDVIEQKYALLMTEFKDSLTSTEEKLSHSLTNNYNLLRTSKENIDTIKKRQLTTNRTGDEMIWAQVFNNTVANSNWLTDKTFSPGRWALGYPALYLLYRVLNEFQPQSILELGLGQSTKMITQYIQTNPAIQHSVVETDLNWNKFYGINNVLSERTKFIQLDTELVPFKESNAVRIYKGFQKQFSGQKFDLVVIDAPWSGDMKEYARIDILSILPDCLKDSFVIIFDDTDRNPESATVQLIKELLAQHGVPYIEGIYRGAKDTRMITDTKNSFLCTM